MSSSSHRPLDPDHACLQFLYQDGTLTEILPSGKMRLLSIDSTLTCKLIEVPVEEAPPYVAVSYYWGKAKDLSVIDINGRSWHLRRHVCDMICNMFETHKEALIWVDMLCINQSCERDQENQVGQMGSIYGRAMKVYAWLGDDMRLPGGERAHGNQCAGILDETDDLAKVFEVLLDYNREVQELPPSDFGYPGRFEAIYMSKLGRPPTLHGQDDPDTFGDIVGLRPLYSRRYWQRLWPVQELILAKEVIVCYKTLWIDLDVIHGLGEVSGDVGRQMDEGSFHDPIDGAIGWNTMCAILDHRGIRQRLTPGGSADFSIPLDELIQLYAKQNDSGRRQDKVYALRALNEHWRELDTILYDDETGLSTFRRIAKCGLFKHVQWTSACHLWSAMELGHFLEFKALAKEFMDPQAYEGVQEEIWEKIGEKKIPSLSSEYLEGAELSGS